MGMGRKLAFGITMLKHFGVQVTPCKVPVQNLMKKGVKEIMTLHMIW